jgi:hypothetical protein
MNNQSFPKLNSGYYFGEVEFKNYRDLVFVEVTKDTPKPKIIINRIKGELNSRTSDYLVEQTSKISRNSSYLPISIQIKESMLSMVGSSDINENKFTGSLLDSNRNSVGNWYLKSVDIQGLNDNAIEIKKRALLEAITEKEDLKNSFESLSTESTQLDNDIKRASELIGNVKTLSYQGESKLREEKINLDKIEKLNKAAQDRLNQLHQQIIVTQRISPQGTLYESSLESLKLEKKWFFNCLK